MTMEWKLDNEIKCVVHYKNLQLHLSLEVKLTKVSRILKFKQHDIRWLKIYIDFDIDKWTNELVINSIYCKTMKNLRKRINVRLVNNAKDYRKYVSNPSF